MQVNFALNFQVETQPVRQLYRVLHDAERGELWRWKLPEVFPLLGEIMPLNREWQLFTKALNPLMTGPKWRALHGFKTAFTNFDAGYDMPDGSVKPDYVNGWDLGATGVLRYDKCRICGGAIVAGTESGSYLVLDYIDGNQPPPNPETLPIWLKFCALNVVDEVTISRFPQGGGLDVWMALVARKPIKIPLVQVERLDMSQPLPSPYKIYHPWSG